MSTVSHVVFATLVNESRQPIGIVYPYGCSLRVSKPAQPLLSSKDMCFPSNRPVGAVARVGKGTLIVLGSSKIFEDTYLVKEDNLKLFMALLGFMMVSFRLHSHITRTVTFPICRSFVLDIILTFQAI
jgi:hypothetical protein